MVDQLHLIELGRKVTELEKIYRSIGEAVDLILRSTYETLFEKTNTKSLGSINQSAIFEKSTGLLSFDDRN
ncbi:MAG TPA: hypothetical protein VI278_08420 [Nitrososphaeraceae archaeon]